MPMTGAPNTTTLTFSGKTLDFANPKAKAIDIVDIAHGLAGENRFNSQIRRFFSVAEHSVLVAIRVEEIGRPDLAFAALLHDAPEAYTRDIVKPLKVLLGPGYQRITGQLEKAIGKRFGVDPALFKDAVVKAADDHVYEIEAAHLQRGMEADRLGVRILYEGPHAWSAPWPIGLQADAAQALFEMHFKRLSERAAAAGWLSPAKGTG